MMYAKTNNGTVVQYPYSVKQLKKDNPSVSFPREIPWYTFLEYNVYPVTKTTRPQVDHTKTITEETPEFINGSWTQVWSISDIPKENLEKSIRIKRNRLLSDTDWRFRSDMNPSQAWVDYCQALRDLTSQESFPFEVVWPEEPVGV